MDFRNNSPNLSPQPTADLNLETVRTLHQTVVALRAALEQSRSELFELRLRVHSNSNSKAYADTIEKLALENHILRERVLSSSLNIRMEADKRDETPPTTAINREAEISSAISENIDEAQDRSACLEDAVLHEPMKMAVNEEIIDQTKNVLSDQNVTKEQDEKDDTDSAFDFVEDKVCVASERIDVQQGDLAEDLKIENDREESPSQMNNMKQKSSRESDNESEELDDIELIFTTEETKELGVMQEDLVSISDTENWPTSNGQPLQPGTVEKSTQFDEESSGLHMPWTHTLVVETDISKCGIIDENEAPPSNNLRRNTLPSPMPYRPIIHKEVLSASKSPSHNLKFSTSRSPRPNGTSDSKRLPMRPILVEPNSSLKCESEAQTDITALPSYWKSESYLAHKVCIFRAM